MKSHYRTLISLLPERVSRKIYKSHFSKLHTTWLKTGARLPVSALSKHQTLLQCQADTKATILVETGTYLGDTLYALYPAFSELHSIELSPIFYKKARKRFRRLPKIKLHQGDSGKVLHELVPRLKNSAVFWLDGHYSGGVTAKGEKDCPVYEELDAIFNSTQKHFIFIDDARLFVGKDDYPTIEELTAFVKSKAPGYHIEVSNDCIRVLPHQSNQ